MDKNFLELTSVVANLIDQDIKKNTSSDNVSTSPASSSKNKALNPIAIMAQNREKLPEYNVQNMSPMLITMKSGEADIRLVPESALIYTPFNLNYSKAALAKANVWHQIILHHEGKFAKNQLSDAIFLLCYDEDIIPVAYREYSNADFFLLRGCNKAIVRMFEANLKLVIPPLNIRINMTIRLGIAKFDIQQIHPPTKIQKVVHERSINAELYGFSNLLNLDALAEHKDLSELILSLSHKFHFEIVVRAMTSLEEFLKKRFNCLKLTNNSINFVTPLTPLKSMNFTSLDLRFNKIKHPAKLRPIKDWNLAELYVDGNALTDVPNYVDAIKEYFPSVLKVDNNILARKPKPITGGDDELDYMADGDIYCSETKMDVFNFYRIYEKSKSWHQVIVCHNGNYEKEEILKSLYEALDDCEFYPCYYKTFSRQDEFLVYNAFDALYQIVQNKFTFKMINTGEAVQVILKMNVSDRKDGQINIDEKIQLVVQERYSSDDRCLNLNEAQQYFNSLKLVEFSFANSRTVAKVLSMAAKNIGQTCFTIRLRNNQINDMKFILTLAYFPKLVCLDLRNNDIDSLDYLEMLKSSCNIRELYLDLNPICNKYETIPEYIRIIKQFFPAIERIDGIQMSFPSVVFAQNFLCAPEGYKFTESFVKQFFTMYDSFQRINLKSMYHDKAIFSMSSNFTVGKVEEFCQTFIDAYTKRSRNILKYANIEYGRGNLFIGPEKIEQLLKTFPQTEHDPYTFTVDVPIFNAQSIVITVSGAFKQKGSRLLAEDFILGFTRTFFIRPCGKGKGIYEKAIEYKIHNEQLHIYSLSAMVKGNAFKYIDDMEIIFEDSATLEEEKEHNLILFQELTKLDRTWSRRCMEEGSWNMKVALNVFIKLYESNKIPENAFER